MKEEATAKIPVTVVMRSYNDADLLCRTLRALDEQEGVAITLLVFESASTDASKKIFEAHGYDWIKHLEPGSYRSSKVLNEGVERAETELVAFVNSDAIMIGRDVLRRMAEALLADDRRAGAFARQIVRPEANAMTRVDYHVAFDNRSQLGERAAAWMSLVCSMVRKTAVAEVAFDAELTFAEDAVWSQAIIDRGWRTVYVPEAIVEHSHDYNWEQRYRRTFGDSAALARLAESEPARGLVAGFLLPYAKRCVRDVLRLREIGKLHHFWRVPIYRWPLMRATWKGSVAGWDYFHGRSSESSGERLQPVIARK
jgi:rhamnosyltransferase